MRDWSPLDWVAFGLIAIAAIMPALGLAVSAEPALSRYFAKTLESRWWKLVPAGALVVSALIVAANQFGWIDHSPEPSAAKVVTQTVTKTVHVPTADPAQAKVIRDLTTQVQADAEEIAKLRAVGSKHPRGKIGSDNTVVGSTPASMGSRNTFVRDADANRNVIHSRTEAIGANAHAAPDSVAIGSGAGTQSETVSTKDKQALRALECQQEHEEDDEKIKGFIDEASFYQALIGTDKSDTNQSAYDFARWLKSVTTWFGDRSPLFPDQLKFSDVHGELMKAPANLSPDDAKIWREYEGKKQWLADTKTELGWVRCN